MAKVSPWKKEFKVFYNPRFHAPHIKTINGRPMVFSLAQEVEVYFTQFRSNL
jgi:hypothetical protein